MSYAGWSAKKENEEENEQASGVKSAINGSAGNHSQIQSLRVNVPSAHKEIQIRHFADGSSAMERLLPGNVSVKHGSVVVETLVDLSKELSGSMFVRLTGGSLTF
ncbi:hypothetical protein JG688_00003839 [Phytophthora aleatoria]|uniref:Uncharacterized protein n=1 Tax=Phytophthora aleatoria TaxID=2496075 RepID=A0A8J5IYJ5_9STRA|nr:hypothetical protein JG688_00003839 [Phytophthora aleatoria]